VIIAGQTPGVLLKADAKRLYVSFELPIDGKEVFVTFELGRNGDKVAYFMYPDKMGDKGEMLVDYGGKIYGATSESRVAYLEVDASKMKVYSHEARQVPGRKVTDTPNK
jgi:hypothetical protein